MKKEESFYNTKQVVYGIVAALLLSWLTVCLPYVNEAQNPAKAAAEKTEKKATADNGNPLSNTNEERSENGTSLLSEYLHEAPVIEQHFIVLSASYRCHPSALYLAYHPELVIPPPEV